MAGGSLITTATLQCPHGGAVQIVSSNTRVKASAPMATASDTFIIAGCAFNVSGAPSPCVSVKWIVTDLRVKAVGARTLSLSSVGLCLNAAQAPQGPVIIANTQPRVKSQ